MAACEVDAATEAEFAVDAGQVGLDGLDADVQGDGDLRVGLPGGDEVGDAPLSRREGVIVTRRKAGAPRLGQRLPPPGAEAVEGGGGFVEGFRFAA